MSYEADPRWIDAKTRFDNPTGQYAIERFANGVSAAFEMHRIESEYERRVSP